MTNHPSRRKSAKQRFLDFIAEHGLEIDHERGSHGGHHLVAHAPEGRVFTSGIDIVCLWDSELGNPPDWTACRHDLDQFLPTFPAKGLWGKKP